MAVLISAIAAFVFFGISLSGDTCGAREPGERFDGKGMGRSIHISPELKRKIESRDQSGPITVIVRLKPATRTKSISAGLENPRGIGRPARLRKFRSDVEQGQAPFLKFLRGKEARRPLLGHNGRSFWISNCISVRIMPGMLEHIAAHPDVMEVAENAILSLPPVSAAGLLEEGGTAFDLWNMNTIGISCVRDMGLDGIGVRIGHLDTGLDMGHPDLAGKVAAWSEFDKAGNRIESSPHETHHLGHGTHTASIMVGDGTGVAPGAALLSALVLPGGCGTLEQALAGMEWVLDPDGVPSTDDGAQIVNMSWGTVEASAILREAVENMISLGVLPVAAVGNGSMSFVRYPGGVPEALGVGAVDADDAVEPYSGGGAVCWHDLCVLKPDISAPGTDICGARPGGGYRLLTGTSTAAPHVAGSAALLLQHSPLPVDQLKDLLLHSSLDLGSPGHDPRYGKGRLDMASAAYFLERYRLRRGAPDLVLERKKDFHGFFELTEFNTYFSDGQGGLCDRRCTLFIVPDSFNETIKTVGLADVTGDGYSDLVVSRTAPLDPQSRFLEFRVYPGGEREGFSDSPYTWFSTLSPYPDPFEMKALADVNGDKRADLVLCEVTEQQNLRKYTVTVIPAGQGNLFGKSEENWCTLYAHNNFRIRMRLGDVNGDGKADLVYAEEYGDSYGRYPVVYYTARSDGTRFSQPSFWLITYPRGISPGIQASPGFLGVSEINGDGLADLILTSCLAGGEIGVFAYASDGKNRFLPGRMWAELDPEDRVEALVDVNNDGFLDLIVGRLNNESSLDGIRVRYSDGKSGFNLDESTWFDPDETGPSPDEVALTGVADIGLGDWQD